MNQFRVIFIIISCIVISMVCILGVEYANRIHSFKLFVNDRDILNSQQQQHGLRGTLSTLFYHLIDKYTPDVPDWLPFKPYDTSDMYSNLYPSVVDSKNEHVRTFAEYIPQKAINNTVMVSFTDFAYLESFYSSYKISQLSQYESFIVVAVDLKSYRILKDQNYSVAYYQPTLLSEETLNKEQKYHSKNWNEKMVSKIKIIRQVVLLGFNVLMFDSDVLLFQDPLPFILSIDGFDLIAQKDSLVCCGFMFYRPSLQSLYFLNLILKYMRVFGLSDQPTVQILLRLNLQPSLRWTLLPTDRYTNGDLFFNSHQFYRDQIDNKQIMVHNNFVKGSVNKLYRLKEMKLYHFDRNQEYSNATAKYIMLEKIQLGNEKKAMKILIHVANLLGRSFVVPRLTCTLGITLEYCNLCGNEAFTCHNDVLMHAELPWKENVFFEQDLVPNVIKQEYLSFNPLSFHKYLPSVKEGNGLNQQPIVFISIIQSDNPVNTIMHTLSSFTANSVIVIHSIDDILSCVC